MKYLKLFESEDIAREIYNKVSPVIDEYKYIIEDNGDIDIKINCPSAISWFYGKCLVTLVRLNDSDTDKFRKSPEFLEFVDRISEDLPGYIVDSSKSDKPAYPGGGYAGFDSMGNIRIEIRKRLPWEMPDYRF